MGQFLLVLIAALALAGCGKKTTPAEPESNAAPKVAEDQLKPPEDESKKPEPPKVETKTASKIPANAFVNSLGMPFLPVPETKVSFCIWETRVKDYAAYADANTEINDHWKEPAQFKSRGFKQPDSHPVVMISWEDANAFCEWLTKKELENGLIKAGQKYRLPTDAEWSIVVGLAQETGDTPESKSKGNWGIYPWGKTWSPPKGAGNYGKDLKVDAFNYTSPVGSFEANEFGLHDMGGNVHEWCEDKRNPNELPRVLRGGAWPDSITIILRSSFRSGNTPGARVADTGFRCVLESK
ncbi:MAG: hypothetical protein CMO74_07840 [Verrucomicrobiales bacterium]|nr:hypothetical protein [Verrucomicrobiales bacterium]|tara:strand:+ start:3942 stop:4829 length:888 start_codon:yes stop_codon:yes gene_type:complete